MHRSQFSEVVMPIVRTELRRFWHDSNKNQDEVGAQLGISGDHLQRVCSGKRRPGVEVGVVYLARLDDRKVLELIHKVRACLGTPTLVVLFLPLFPELVVL